MKQKSRSSRTRRRVARSLIALLLLASLGALVVVGYSRNFAGTRANDRPPIPFQEKKRLDTSGFAAVLPYLDPWPPTASLEDISHYFERVGFRNIEKMDKMLAQPGFPDDQRIVFTLAKASLFNYEAQPDQAYKVLAEARAWLNERDALASQWLGSVIFFQGATTLRQGENDNCIMCRGESSCILPISLSAVHTRPDGSRLAIKHFTEYLEKTLSEGSWARTTPVIPIVSSGT
jgi:hypothetical protein